MHLFTISDDQHFLFTLCTDELAIKEVERITFVRLKSYLSKTVESLYRFLVLLKHFTFQQSMNQNHTPFVNDKSEYLIHAMLIFESVKCILSNMRYVA